MGSHPLNLMLRFLLELAALASIAYWAWYLSEDWTQYVFAIGIPIGFVVIWGVFNVPGDPSRSGKAPVKVPGIVRLLIELGIFSFAAYCLYVSELSLQALIFVVVTLVHYATSYDRIIWLLKKK